MSEATLAQAVLPREWFIERVNAKGIAAAIDRWKALRADGWETHAIHEKRSGDVIGFGYKPWA